MRSNSEWETLAQIDPLHAIASDRGTRRDEGGWEHEAFFAKGETYLELVQPERWIPGGTVLDLGCGAGRISRALAGRYEQVIGVDVAPPMVELAGRLCDDVANADFRVSDGVHLPVGDHAVDGVVSLQVLQHVDRAALPDIFVECRRVVRPGGRVVLHVPAPRRKDFASRLTMVPARRWATKAALKLRPSLDVSRRGWVVGQYHTYRPARVLPMLAEAGFVDIVVTRFRPGQPHTTMYVATAPWLLGSCPSRVT